MQGQNKKISLIVISICSLFLLAIDRYYPWLIGSFAMRFCAPIYVMARKPMLWFEYMQMHWLKQDDLIAENERLQAMIAICGVNQQKYLAIEQENKRLLGLINSVKSADRFIVATVLSPNIGDNNIVVLDKGKDVGVYVGQLVMDAYGVYGKVIDVARSSSQVLLITNSRSAISVQVMRNGLHAIAMGTNSEYILDVVHISELADVKVGDVLVTSRLGNLLPYGYIVGYIDKITKSGNGFLNIQAKAAAHIAESSRALLLWPNDKKNDHER